MNYLSIASLLRPARLFVFWRDVLLYPCNICLLVDDNMQIIQACSRRRNSQVTEFQHHPSKWHDSKEGLLVNSQSVHVLISVSLSPLSSATMVSCLNWRWRTFSTRGPSLNKIFSKNSSTNNEQHPYLSTLSLALFALLGFDGLLSDLQKELSSTITNTLDRLGFIGHMFSVEKTYAHTGMLGHLISKSKVLTTLINDRTICSSIEREGP